MIDDLNKFEIADKLEKLKTTLHDPEVAIFDFPESLYDEIMNMPKDKDGGVPKHYLSDGLKSIMSIVDHLVNKEECERHPIDDIITDDFFGTLWTKIRESIGLSSQSYKRTFVLSLISIHPRLSLIRVQ